MTPTELSVRVVDDHGTSARHRNDSRDLSIPPKSVVADYLSNMIIRFDGRRQLQVDKAVHNCENRYRVGGAASENVTIHSNLRSERWPGPQCCRYSRGREDRKPEHQYPVAEALVHSGVRPERNLHDDHTPIDGRAPGELPALGVKG